MMNTRVLLVPNNRNTKALAAAQELEAWLAEEGFEPVLAAEDAAAVGVPSRGVVPTEIGTPALAVALGGDGTILKAVHVLGEVDTPILGVNLGRLGFLSGASGANMRAAVTTALAGEGKIECRATLEAEVVMEGRVVGRYRALNEVTLGRGSSGRVIEIALDINGARVTTLTGDGVVVATPTGSTAYALSVGGPIVSPEVPCQVVVPVAPHTLAQRAMVLSPSDVVDLRLMNPARRDACIHVDGEVMPCRRSIESVSVRRGSHEVRLVKLEGRDFFEVVRAEFLGS